MKQLHVHVGVSDLEKSIRYYTALFGESPTKEERGYAKWMLEEPRVNFAISVHRGEPGINHLGMQVDSEEELAELHARAEAANALPPQVPPGDVRDHPGGQVRRPAQPRTGFDSVSHQEPHGPRPRHAPGSLDFGGVIN